MSRLVRNHVLLLAVVFAPPALAHAQNAPVAAPAREVQQTQGGMTMPMPAGHQMTMSGPLGLDDARDGSGTSWLPDQSPSEGAMRHHGPWMLMLHGAAFGQFVKTGSDRGDHQVGSVNWIMGMARRDVGHGQLLFRGMLSADALTVGRCGYPNLLQTGELCRNAALHDQQHPHDLFMELAADYRRALNDTIAVQVYGGPAGEPALGPTAYPHRMSARTNPMAPITHHWLDATHVSFGVVTGAVYGRVWKVEASSFNGREPDDRRYNIDLAKMDSYSARVTLMPSPQWAIQLSAGHLAEAERRVSGAREDVDRFTASATYHRLRQDRLWATTVAWGRNREAHHATSALTAETTIDLSTSTSFFGRGDVVSKTATDLALPPATFSEDETFTVAKVQAGLVRWIAAGRGVKAGVGGLVGISMVPAPLRSIYGGRSAGELSVFLLVRAR